MSLLLSCLKSSSVTVVGNAVGNTAWRVVSSLYLSPLFMNVSWFWISTWKKHAKNSSSSSCNTSVSTFFALFHYTNLRSSVWPQESGEDTPWCHHEASSKSSQLEDSRRAIFGMTKYRTWMLKKDIQAHSSPSKLSSFELRAYEGKYRTCSLQC